MSIRITGPGSEPKRSHTGDAIAASVIILILCAAGILLYLGFRDYDMKRSMELVWEKIQHIADSEDPEAPDIYISDDGEEILVTEEVILKDYLYRPINLAALREVNPDVSGYIYIPNTQVDYPILKETEPEAYFYLNNNIYRKADKYGSIFELSDAERGIPGTNNAVNIIFGHHMASGAMFSGIYSYQEQDFMDNPVYIYRDDYRIEYRAFAVCVLHKNDPVYDFDAYELSGDNYSDLLERVRQISKTEYDGEWPDPGQEITVLSTCKGASGTPNRLLVFLIETRRATVPEYYDSIKDVEQYGGSREQIEIDPETMRGQFDYDGGMMNDLLDNDNDNNDNNGQ